MTLFGLFPSSALVWRECWEAICVSLKMPKTSWNWRSTWLRNFTTSPQASSQSGFSQIKMATHLCEAFFSRECGQWAVNCSDAWKVFPKRPHVKHLLNHELPLNNNGMLLQAGGGLSWSWYLAHTRAAQSEVERRKRETGDWLTETVFFMGVASMGMLCSWVRKSHLNFLPHSCLKDIRPLPLVLTT